MTETKTITARVPHQVYNGLKKKVKEAKKEQPSYRDADVVRLALVQYLKSKGYLDKRKDYL